MIILSCVLWILYFQLKKKIATRSLQPVMAIPAALELDEEEDEEETYGTTTFNPTSTTRGPSIPPPPPPISRAGKKAKTDGSDMAEELSRRVESARLLHDWIGALLDPVDERQLSRQRWGQWITGMMLHIND